jgi:mRNA interferase MazF
MILFRHLVKKNVGTIHELSLLDLKRFPSQPSGKLSDAKMQDIETVVRYCLGL